MVATGVSVRKARQVIEAANNVRVDGAMAIAALQRAADIGRPFQAVVSDSAGIVGRSLLIEPGVIRGSRAVVDAAIANVHQKRVGVELCLREASAAQPGEITRTTWHIADQVPRANLVLTLAQQLGFKIRVDRNHIRLRRHGCHARGGELDDKVEEAQSQRSCPDGLHLKLVNQL